MTAYHAPQHYNHFGNTLDVPIDSPFLGRTAWVTAKHYRLMTLLMKSAHDRSIKARWHNQRQLAALAGYESVGSLNKALHHLARLGLIAISTTRGRYGSTVAWVRRGVRAIAHALNVPHPPTDLRIYPSGGPESVGNNSLGGALAALMEGGR